jgi:hypothetical protein
VQLLLYYGEDLATWTEALSGPPTFLSAASTLNSTATTFTPGNTTVGLPHVTYDVCGVLGCRGRTHQVRVVLQCA